MHRYSAASAGSNTGNNREASARRTVQLTSYKLKCDKEALSPRLGPPDYYPPAPNCAEELLTRETCQHGYKEVIDGVEEGRETSCTLIGNGSNALWTKENINRYKESLRKRLRAVTNALIRRRKAGQVYDVPLQGNLLAKPGFPERQSCGEDFRRKWIDDLSQRKRLGSLADHVPHGFHKRTLFEGLVKQNVPFLRATWFIKVLYLNQVRPQSVANSAGVGDKSQVKRFEQWTRDLLEYAQSVLDELCQNGRYQAGDSCHGYDGVEPDAQVKWNYLVRLLQWQYAEGLIQQSQVVDWALKQIQEKDSLEKLERVLPLLLESIDLLALSQVHVRMLVYISIDWLRQLGAATSLPNPVDSPQHHQVAAMLVELLRYLLVAVPDTFVAFDCFPLPPCIFALEGSGTPKEEMKSLPTDAQKASNSAATPYREVFVAEVVDSIQKRASLLTKAVNPGVLRSNEGKVIQMLDRSVVSGDVCTAYSVIFDGDFSGYEQLPAEWKELSSSPFLSGIMNNVNLSDLFAVRFICEWAICDFRDMRQKTSRAEKKLAGIKDMSRVYMAVSVICMRKSELESSSSSRVKKSKSSKTGALKAKSKAAAAPSRGSMHDIIVAWIDQHELRKGDGLLRMQLLLSELVRKGIFHPETYVRQLIVEGVLEKRETQADITRACRHRHALRFLPGPANVDLVEESKDSEDIPENVRMYRNERRLALQGFASDKKKEQLSKDSTEKVRRLNKETAKVLTLTQLKQAVSAYLQFPDVGVQQKLGTSTVLKRPAAEITPGCDECLRNKRQKIEGKASAILVPQEADDTWWLKKVSKVADPVIKSEISVKPPKQTVRGRPKTARKTQSLAHLQRIDGSQGASSSHTCDSRVQCPHHRAINKSQSQLNETQPALRYDLRSVGSSIKQLRFPEKYAFSSWINRTVRTLLSTGSVASNPATEVRWCLTEERFAAVVYMLDAAVDFQSLLRLLLWLLPGKSNASKDIGEGTILSCLRRYESVLTTMNLLPEALSVLMQCASAMGSGAAGRASCSMLLSYVRELLRKYVSLPTVQTWERNWKMSCDQKVALEFEAMKAAESDSGLGYMGMFGTSVGDEREDPIPQRLNSRVARSIGSSMRDIVQRGMVDLDRDMVGDRTEEYTHRVATGLLDGIKQHGSVQADTTAINAAVSAIVNNASTSAAVFCEGLSNVATAGPDGPSARAARRVLQAHTQCLRLVKEGLDERQSRILEAALATEASTIVAGLFVQNSGRAPRSQFHLSPETPELGTLGDYGGPGSTTTTTIATTTASGRAAAATALVALAAIQGVVSLERIISVLKIRDNLEALQLPKLLYSSSNGLSRGSSLASNMKSDNMVESHLYWFRALVGDFRTVSNGLVADILGEANVVAFCRAQRLLPLNLVFTMAYSMFCGLLRRKVLSHMHIISKDDGVVQSLTAATKDIVAHEPFRESCLQDTRALYLHLLTDIGSPEYAAILDGQGLDIRFKKEAMLPFSARLFLYALLDRRLPSSMEWQDEETWMNVRSGFEHSRQVEHIVRILDEIQPATFHWQWLELRLLLHEQVFLEKIEAQNSAAKAVQAVAADPAQLSECEKSFAEMVLTRLLCRPDAAALYSEVLNCVGTCKLKHPERAGDRPRLLEDHLIKLVTRVLKGSDVLLGRKSLRQLLEICAQNKNFSIRTISSVRSWCWQPLATTSAESVSLEEGEVQVSDASKILSPPWEEAGQHFITEKALANLILPCLARSQNDMCSGFASELVTQMTELEQQVRTATARPPTAGMPEGSVSRVQGSRRGARCGLEAGSPGVRRRQVEPSPLAAALQSSIWLRLQFLLPLLRIIYSDREPTARNMRLTLAPILLRLLGTRIVQEPAESFHSPASGGGGGREAQWNAELSSLAATAAAGEELFDRLLSVLHALMSNTWAIWLKPRASPKAPAKHPREVPPFDRDTAERMQTELDRMQLPRSTRMRLQAAMPVFPPQATPTVAAAPPEVPLSSFSMLQASLSANSKLSEQQQRLGSSSVSAGLEAEAMALDPWTLLEDGTGVSTITTAGTGTTAGAAAVSLVSSSVATGGTTTDPTLKACPWLRGAVRVRRTDLTYVGSVDSSDT